MSIDFPVLLAAIVIDDDNDTIVLREGGVDYTCTVIHGTYYLKGDGDDDDILYELINALNAAPAANSYAATGVTCNRNRTSLPSTFSISRSAGVNNFQIKWTDVLTTFPHESLGFIAQKGAESALAETPTGAATHLWAGTGHIEDAAPRAGYVVSQQTTADGDTDIVLHSDVSKRRELIAPMTWGERVFAEHAAKVPLATDGALEKFLKHALDGRPVQFHRCELQPASDVNFETMSSVTTYVSTQKMGEQCATMLDPAPRSQMGIELFDLTFLLEGAA
jgi:hypothetical protein